MDFIDLVVDSSDEFLSGYYYKKRPRGPEDGQIKFTYKQRDPNSKVFATVLGNVRADKATYAISTNDNCGFAVGEYIITQNGLIWEITDVANNEESGKNNDALRWFKSAVNAECYIRMVQIDDLYERANAYVSVCEIKINFSKPIDYISAWETSTDETLPVKIVEDYRSAIISVNKNMAVTVSAVFSGSGERKVQIPAVKTLEDELVINYEV